MKGHLQPLQSSRQFEISRAKGSYDRRERAGKHEKEDRGV